MKKSFLIYCILMSAFWAMQPFMLCAQEPITGEEPSVLPKEQTVYSPQVAEMIRYDRTSLQLNTGCVDLNIPLTEWSDPDFDFPVSIFYDSSGFRPRDTDNYVGRNWMLGIGGVVYRKVNGIPDDMQHFPEPVGGEKKIDGFLNVLGKHYFDLNRMESSFLDNPYQYTRPRDLYSNEPTLVLDGKDSFIESSADVFYFSFGKHSGKFVINYDGTVSACGDNGGTYEVDLRDMQMISRKEDKLNTRIHIKTDDGYVYTFGGEGYASLEYNISWEDNFSAQPAEAFDLPHVISAFHLTQITAPNGRTLTIKYRDTNPEYHTAPSDLRTLATQVGQVDENIRMQYIFSGRSVYQEYSLYPLNFKKSDVFKATRKLYTLTKAALVDYVTTGQMQLYFHYSSRSVNPYYNDRDHGRFPYTCGAKLDEMEVYARGIHKVVSLNYTYQAGGRMFLDRVTTDNGIYSFKYNKLNVPYIPTPMTSNIDHWGFWRGIKENTGIVPALEMSDPYSLDYQDYVIASDDRDATGEYTDCTLLSHVYYPTGGSTSYEYEANHYSHMPRPDSGSSYYPGGVAPIGKIAIAGGARVRAITHYLGTGTPVKKSIFTYGSDAQQGELTYMPYYKYTRTRTTGTFEFTIDGICVDSEGITDMPYPSVHIRYPQVTEHSVSPYAQVLQKSYSRKVTFFAERIRRDFSYYMGDYTYSSYEGNPWIVNPETYFPTYTLKAYNRNILAHPSLDVSRQYGKVERELYYDADNVLVKECEYYYSFHNQDKYALRTYMPFSHFGMRTGLYGHLLKEPLFEYLLDKKITTVYSSSDSQSYLRNAEFSKYDRDGLLSEYATVKNNGDSLVTRYVRRRFDTLRGFQLLPVSETLSLCTKDGETMLRKDSTIYGICSSTIFDNYYFYTPSERCSYGTSGHILSRDSYMAYDSYGNLLSETKGDGRHTVYVWGHAGWYLLGCIENATREEVERALGCTLDDYSKYSEEASSLDELRILLPQASVYTYAYEGSRMIRATAPNGQSTFYSYDRKERLKETYRIGEEGCKEILQHNDYHIVNE